jgi:hypothetical protein
MSKEKLKPCPFSLCEGKAQIVNAFVPGEFYIYCGNCGRHGEVYHTKANAVTVWNNMARIAELESQLAAYHEAEKIVADPPHDQECCGCVAILRKQLTAKTCEWKYEPDNYEYPQDGDEFWNTGCGHAYRFTEGGPEENGIKFCMYCGGKIKLPSQAKPTEQAHAPLNKGI